MDENHSEVTSYICSMAQIERPAILTVGREVSNWTCPTLLVGMYRGAIICTIPYEVKHIPTISTHTRTSYHSVDQPQVGPCESERSQAPLQAVDV